MTIEESRRSSSSPQTSLNGKSTPHDATSLAGMLNVLFTAVVYLYAVPLLALARPMKAALRLLLVLARRPAQVSRWIGIQRASAVQRFSSVLSASTVLLLRIIRAFLALSQSILRKPFVATGRGKPTEKLEEKINILTQQLQLCHTRLENVEQLPKSSALPDFHQTNDMRRTSFADRRRSYPEEYSMSLRRMLSEARAVSGSQYCDSPESDNTSSCHDQDSMPPTPALIPSRRMTSRQERRRSTGLKPLLLPSILALESSTSPPSRYMYRSSWHERPLAYDDVALPITEEDEVLRCDTPCRLNEDMDLEEAQFAIAESPICLEDSKGLGGLNLIISGSANTLPSIPSKRSFSFVEA